MLFNRIKTRREAIENAKAFILTQYAREELRGEIFPGRRNSDFTEAMNAQLLCGLLSDILPEYEPDPEETEEERRRRARHISLIDKLHDISGRKYWEIGDVSFPIVSAAVAELAREVA